MLSEISQSQKDTIWFHLNKVSRGVKFVDAESTVVVTRSLGLGEEGGIGNYYLMGTKFQFCKMKRVLEMDGGDSQQCGCFYY